MDVNSPAWRDPKLTQWNAQRERCADVLAGLDRLREKAATYNPKLPRESVANYRIRLTVGELTNLLGGAVRASEGLITAKPPALLEGIPARTGALWQDIDGAGTAGVVWLREVLRRMLTETTVIAVASTPVRAGVAVTRAQETALALRPYVALYRVEDVMSYRFARIGGRRVLTQLVLRERVEELDGAYGTKLVTQYRVLRRIEPGNHESMIFRDNERGDFVPYGEPEVIQTAELPVVEFSSDPTAGFAQGPPPVLDLADLTLGHYRVTNDRRWSMRQACFPWLVRTGYQPPPEGDAVGPTEALDLPLHGTAQFIAPPDTAFTPTRDELTDIERRAAALSLSFLSGEHAQANETATAANIDQEGQDAGLAAILVSVRDGLNRLFALFDEMLGEAPRDEYFTVSTKLRGMRRDPQLLRVVVDAWKEGGLPMGAMLHALQHGELPDDFDVEAAALEAMAEAETAHERAMEMARERTPANPTTA